MILFRSRAPAARNVVVASGKKTDLKKQGLESIKNAVVKQNLMGVSKSMDKKGWTDPSGRKGKVQLEVCALISLRGFSTMYRLTTEEVDIQDDLCWTSYCACWHQMDLKACILLCRALECTVLPTSMAPMWMATLQSTPLMHGRRLEANTAWEPRDSLHGKLLFRVYSEASLRQ